MADQNSHVMATATHDKAPQGTDNAAKRLEKHLNKFPETAFIRVMWLEISSFPRARTFTVEEAVRRLSKSNTICGIATMTIGGLPNDTFVSNLPPVTERDLIPIIESARAIDICVLERAMAQAEAEGLKILIGAELEVVFVEQDAEGELLLGKRFIQGYAWSALRAVSTPKMAKLILQIARELARARIDLQQFHSEGAQGQFEFSTAPVPPLEAADTLIMARYIIQTVAEQHGYRATFVPKPFAKDFTSGQHIHLSIEGAADYTHFYAGILSELPAIMAIVFNSQDSFDRVQDSCWAGGRHVAWGTQNRECPLRKVEGSHWEFRWADGLSHPYYTLAALIFAGVRGLRNETPLAMKDCQQDPANLSAGERAALGITKMIPDSWRAAADELEANRDLIKDFGGREFLDLYMQVKKGEQEMLDAMPAEERMKFLIERF